MPYFVFYFVFLALLTAAFFRAVHTKLGAPRIESGNSSGYFAVNNAGMILSWLGAWICAKFNQFERSRPEPLKSGEVITNQHRHALFRIYNEQYISGLNDADFRQVYNNTFRHQLGFINPYKAVFLCPPCTLFWLAQIFFWPAVFWAGLSWFWIGVFWLFFEPLTLLWYQLIEAILDSHR